MSKRNKSIQLYNVLSNQLINEIKQNIMLLFQFRFPILVHSPRNRRNILQLQCSLWQNDIIIDKNTDLHKERSYRFITHTSQPFYIHQFNYRNNYSNLTSVKLPKGPKKGKLKRKTNKTFNYIKYKIDQLLKQIYEDKLNCCFQLLTFIVDHVPLPSSIHWLTAYHPTLLSSSTSLHFPSWTGWFETPTPTSRNHFLSKLIILIWNIATNNKNTQ